MNYKQMTGETFRLWNVCLIKAMFAGIDRGEKIEKLIFNASIDHISKYNKTPSLRQFRVVYNWITQIVFIENEFVRDSVKSGTIKPSELIDTILARVRTRGEKHTLYALTPEADIRAPERCYFGRILVRELGEEKGVFVEKSISDEHVSLEEYKKQARKVVANIVNSETCLKKKILEGSMSPNDVGSATHKTLWPELWSREDMQTGHISSFANQESSTEHTGTLFQCGSCKKYSVETREFQVRSSDEPMTVFCHCTACGKRWKM